MKKAFLLLLLSLTFWNSAEAVVSISSRVFILDNAGINLDAELAVSTGGRAVAIWVDTFTTQIQTSIFNGSTWSVSPITIGSGAFPEVAIDSAGNAIAVWVGTTGGFVSSQIFSSRFNVTLNAWSAPIQLSLGGLNFSPKIAMDAAGNGLAIWTTNPPQQIIARSFNNTTKNWTTPVAVVNGVSSFPEVGVDNLGHGIIMWNDPNFGLAAIQVTFP